MTTKTCFWQALQKQQFVLFHQWQSSEAESFQSCSLLTAQNHDAPQWGGSTRDINVDTNGQLCGGITCDLTSCSLADQQTHPFSDFLLLNQPLSEVKLAQFPPLAPPPLRWFIFWSFGFHSFFEVNETSWLRAGIYLWLSWLAHATLRPKSLLRCIRLQTTSSAQDGCTCCRGYFGAIFV